MVCPQYYIHQLLKDLRIFLASVSKVVTYSSPANPRLIFLLKDDSCDKSLLVEVWVCMHELGNSNFLIRICMFSELPGTGSNGS